MLMFSGPQNGPKSDPLFGFFDVALQIPESPLASRSRRGLPQAAPVVCEPQPLQFAMGLVVKPQCEVTVSAEPSPA